MQASPFKPISAAHRARILSEPAVHETVAQMRAMNVTLRGTIAQTQQAIAEACEVLAKVSERLPREPE
jgi:hypothetical protein